MCWRCVVQFALIRKCGVCRWLIWWHKYKYVWKWNTKHSCGLWKSTAMFLYILKNNNTKQFILNLQFPILNLQAQPTVAGHGVAPRNMYVKQSPHIWITTRWTNHMCITKTILHSRQPLVGYSFWSTCILAYLNNRSTKRILRKP